MCKKSVTLVGDGRNNFIIVFADNSTIQALCGVGCPVGNLLLEKNNARRRIEPTGGHYNGVVSRVFQHPRS